MNAAPIYTVYAPERTEKVLCETCFQKKDIFQLFLMSFIPPNEKIIEKKNLPYQRTGIFVTDKDLNLRKISPTFAGQKYLIPSPTLCPDERMRRRLVEKRTKTLSRKMCQDGNQIISTIHMTKTIRSTIQKVWNSDDWNPFEFCSDFDFSRPFFPQFDALIKRTPKPALANGFSEKMQTIVINAIISKIVISVSVQIIQKTANISTVSFVSKNCFDCLNIEKCEYCPMNVYDVQLVSAHKNVSIVAILVIYSSVLICSGCHDCFGCTNLRNKSYYFSMNHSRKKSTKKSQRIQKSSEKNQAPIRENEWKILWKNAIYRDTNNINCEACTGDFLHGCKNITQKASAAKWLIDCKYISLCPGETNNAYI